MIFTETELNRLATAKILHNDFNPSPDEERLHLTRLEFFPDNLTFSIRGDGRNNRVDHISVDELLAYVHPDYHSDVMEQIETMRQLRDDSCQFSVVSHTLSNLLDYRVLVITLFADYEGDTDKIVRYSGTLTDVTGFVMERRNNIKFRHKSRFLEEQFKTALWSVDPYILKVYCNKMEHDDFYHDYDAYDFVNMLYPDSKDELRKIIWDMHALNYDKGSILLHVHYSDDSEHYLQCEIEPMLNEKGEIFRYLIYSYDVSEQKKMEFRTKTFHSHLHKMMDESGFRLFYYQPGSGRLHIEDPYADPRLLNISIDDYLKRVLDDDKPMLRELFNRCDQFNFDRREFTYRMISFTDDTLHRYRNIVLPVFDENGQLQSYGLLRIDITHEYNNQAVFNYAQSVGKIGAWSRDLIAGTNQWTDEMYRIFDFPRQVDGDPFGKVQELVEPEDLSYMVECMRNLFKIKDNDPVLNFRIRTKNGERKYLELRMHIDRNRNNIPVFAYGTLADVTDRMNLQMEKEKADVLLHTLLRHFPSMVFVKDIDDEFRVVAANDVYAQYFNKPLEAVEGKCLKEYCEDDSLHDYIQSDVEAVGYTSENPKIEFVKREKKQGEIRYYQKCKFAQRVSGRNLLICTATDVTDLHRAKEKAEESDRLKSAFLANMSHEIRTPLNAIVGFSNLIVSSSESEENVEFLKIIRDNSNHLLRLINDILDISKLEANSMRFSYTEFDLCDMLRETCLSLKMQFADKGLALTESNISGEYIVYQDRVRVEEIVNNFLTNACKHTSHGGAEVRLDFHDERFRISVSDTGTGIAKDKLHSIFNRFEKVDEFKEGTGLGLSICEGLTKALGGEIGVESELGKGSTFWVDLPVRVAVAN